MSNSLSPNSCCCGCDYFDLQPSEQTTEERAAALAMLTGDTAGVSYDGAPGGEYFLLPASAELESTRAVRSDYVGVDVLFATELNTSNAFKLEFFQLVEGVEDVVASYQWTPGATGTDPNSDPAAPLSFAYAQALTAAVDDAAAPTIQSKSTDLLLNHHVNLFDDTVQANFSTNVRDLFRVSGNDDATYLRSLTRKRYDLVPLYVRLVNLSTTDPLRLHRFRAYKLDRPSAVFRCGDFDKINSPYIRNAPLAITCEIESDPTQPVGAAYLAGWDPAALVGWPTAEAYPSTPNRSFTTTYSWDGPPPGWPPADTRDVYATRADILHSVPTIGDVVYNFKLGHRVDLVPLYRLAGRVVCELTVTLAYYTSTADLWNFEHPGPFDGETSTGWDNNESNYYYYWEAGALGPGFPAGYYTYNPSNPFSSYVYYGASLPTLPGPTVTYPAGETSPGYDVDRWVRPGHTEHNPPPITAYASKTEPARTWQLSLPEWNPGEFEPFTLDTTALAGATVDGVLYLSVPDLTTAPPRISQATYNGDADPITTAFVRGDAFPAELAIGHGGAFFDEVL